MRRFVGSGSFNAYHKGDRPPATVKADFEVVIDDTKLVELARKAYLNKAGKSKDGPVTVTIKNYTEAPIK